MLTELVVTGRVVSLVFTATTGQKMAAEEEAREARRNASLQLCELAADGAVGT